MGRMGASGKSDRKIIDMIYPVGSVYISVSNVSPVTLFGGSWEQLKDRFLLGAGDTYTAGAMGGESTHTLTVNEMPAHGHGISGYALTYSQSMTFDGDPGSARARISGTITPETDGGGLPHNNMPPYLVVYMWKRTA